MAKTILSKVGVLLTALLAPGAVSAATVELELVSRRAYSPGDPGNRPSQVEDVSADGRYVLLFTQASNLAAGIDDDNGVQDLVVFDRVAGSSDLITASASRPGHSADSGGSIAKISADGRYVAYTTVSRDVAAGILDDPSTPDVYLFDRVSRLATLVSHQAGAATTAACGSVADISADGRWVLYASDSTSLVAGAIDTNATRDYFLFDRNSGESTLVGGAAGSPTVASSKGISLAYGLSDNGRWVIFVSYSIDLVAGFADNNGPLLFDAFLFDRDTASSTLITHTVGSATAGAGGSMLDFDPLNVYIQMTPDAAYVTYTHNGNGLIAGASGSSQLQTYRWQRSSGVNQLVSGVNGSATQRANGRSRPNAISADGRYVVLKSLATDLMPGLNVVVPGLDGLYRVDLSGPPPPVLINHPYNSANSISCCSPTARAISADGRYVLFDGSAGGMVEGQTGFNSVFLYDHADGSRQILAHVPGQPTAALLATGRGLSTNGRFSQLESSFDLAGDPGAEPGFNTFVFDRVTSTLGRSSTPSQAGFSAGLVATENIELAGGDLLFHTSAGDLIPGFTDLNQQNDPVLFLRETSSFSPLVQAAVLRGEAPNGASAASFLPDGQAFLLATAATNLAPGVGDGNAGADLYLGQRGSPTYHLASSQLGQASTTANGGVWGGMRATPGGSFVAFDTLATNATAATDANGAPDVVRWTFGSSGGTLISHAAGNPGTTAAGESHLQGISADGSRLLFTSTAGDVTASFVDHNGALPDLYLWETGGSRLLTGQGTGLPNDGSAGRTGESRLTDDGGVVLFEHTGNELLPGITDGVNTFDIFAFDPASGTLSLAVHALGQPSTTPNAESRLYETAAGGRFVLFDSRAGNLVPPAEIQGDENCYLLDRQLDRVFLISHAGGDPLEKAGGVARALSPDGRYVIFASPAEGLVPGQLPSADSQPPYNLILHDRATGERLLITHVPGNPLQPGKRGFPYEAVLAADGRGLAFITTQAGLVASDPGERDLFYGRIDGGGLVFSDGFEMGDSSLWSATQGFAGSSSVGVD